MADEKVSIDGLAAAVNQYLDEFRDAVYEDVVASCEEASEIVLPELKADSPKNTGKYARNWTVVFEKSATWARAIIRNRQYRLVHLLEYGHAKLNGGRTAPQPHVEPAQTEADELFLKLLKRRIEAGK